MTSMMAAMEETRATERLETTGDLIAVTSRKYIKTGCWTDFLSQTYTSLLSSFPDITSMNIPRLLFLSIFLCSSQRRRAKCINFISPIFVDFIRSFFFFFLTFRWMKLSHRRSRVALLMVPKKKKKNTRYF